jgi:diaminopimelate epimerase
MRFTKMHGIGNDYVYVDCFAQPMPGDPAALARKISDRHFGVGSDGLILICPSQRGADACMRMFNADGSEAEMCGNGIRCVAKYVYDHGIKQAKTLRIETGRGVLSLDLEIQGGKVQRVRVNMGEPILEAERIPVRLSKPTEGNRVIDVPITQNLQASLPTEGPFAGARNTVMGLGDWLKGSAVEDQMTCVSMGNPHMVVFAKDVREHAPEEKFGRLFETAPMFPKRINVHFVQVHSPEEVTMRTWERGSGITLACGTGACAVCVAGALSGRTHRRITAHLPGGDLDLEWSEADGNVYMTGPATEVFSGEWPE